MTSRVPLALALAAALAAVSALACTGFGPAPAPAPAPEPNEVVVTATAYNSVPEQGMGAGQHGAWGDRLVPGTKAIAESGHLFNLTGVVEIFTRDIGGGRQLSGVLLIAESHLSLHTWPEARYVAVDIFTCGGLDPRPAIRHLARAFAAEDVRMHEVVRGVPDDVAHGLPLLPGDVSIISRSLDESQ